MRISDWSSDVCSSDLPSIPKMGASGYAYDLARQFGVAVVLPRPALVPFTFDPAVLEKLRPLSGVSADAVVSCGKVRFREALLFTHRGRSGHSILHISSYWQPGTELEIDLQSVHDGFGLPRETKAAMPTPDTHMLLSDALPSLSPLILSH